MVDLNIKADIVPTITAGEELIANALKVVETLASGDQQQKRAIVRDLKRAKKAVIFANKAFGIADKLVEDKRYWKYRNKFEELD